MANAPMVIAAAMMMLTVAMLFMLRFRYGTADWIALAKVG